MGVTVGVGAAASVDEVREHVHAIGPAYEEYSLAVVEHGVDGGTVPLLGEHHLLEMGAMLPGKAMSILVVVLAWHYNHASFPPPVLILIL